MQVLFDLYWTFLKIGFFSIGGGYVAIPLIQELIISEKHWISVSDLINLLSIAQMTPGPLAVNSATFVGSRMAGILGSIATLAGFITPSVIIIVAILFIFKNSKESAYLRTIIDNLKPAVIVNITAAALLILASIIHLDKTVNLANFTQIIDLKVLILTIGFLIFVRLVKLKPTLILLGSAVIGLIFL